MHGKSFIPAVSGDILTLKYDRCSLSLGLFRRVIVVGYVFSQDFPRGIEVRLLLLIAIVLAPMVLLLGWTNFQRFLSLRDIRLQSEAEVAQGIATAFAAYMSGPREHLHITGLAILTFSPYPSEKGASRRGHPFPSDVLQLLLPDSAVTPPCRSPQKPYLAVEVTVL